MSRKIDALVAKHVMGLEEVEKIGGYWVDEIVNGVTIRTALPRYSTDIAAAWSVVEKLGMTYRIEDGTVSFWDEDLQETHEAYEDTPAMAICLAALAAQGVEVD